MSGGMLSPVPNIVLVCAVLVVSACKSDDAQDTATEAAPIVAGALLNERVATLDDDEFALSMPGDITLTEDGILVLDRGNDRIVHFSRHLEPRGSFGREGGGPGEFRSLTGLEYQDGKVFVSDMGNMRVTTLTLNGHILAEYPLPSSTDEGAIAVTAHDTVVAAVTDEEFYLAKPAGDQHWTYFASRAGAGSRGYRMPLWSHFNRVVRGEGSSLYVLQNATGRVLTTTSAGEPVSDLLLPDTLMRYIVDANHKLNVSMVGEERAELTFRPPFKGVGRGPDGSLLLIYARLVGERTFGALLDPATGSLRPLLLPAGSPPNHPLTQIGSAAISNDSLFVTSVEGIRIYGLGPAGS